MAGMGAISAIEWSGGDTDIPSINRVKGLTVSVGSKVRTVREGEQVAGKGPKNAVRKQDVMNQDFCNDNIRESVAMVKWKKILYEVRK